MIGDGERRKWPPDPDADTPASEDDNKGLRCLKCGCRDLRVTHVRDAPAKGRWRRRVCRHCGAVRSTYER